MLIKNEHSFITSLLSISLLVGLFQITQVEDKLNSYGFTNNISSSFSVGKDLQLGIENFKLSFNSSAPPYNLKNTEAIKPLEETPTIVSSINSNITHIEKEPITPLNQTTIIDKSHSKCEEDCTVLMIGDSVMGDVFFSFNRLMKKTHPSWKIINAHKVSSGLSNSTYYDWVQISNNLIKTNQPDFVAILIGTNDAQSILFENKAYSFGNKQWKTSYQNKVEQLLQPIREKDIPYFWIELPQVGLSSFNERLNIVRESQKSQIDKESFIDTQRLLGGVDDPIFPKYRQQDKIHLNAIGSDKIAQQLLLKIQE